MKYVFNSIRFVGFSGWIVYIVKILFSNVDDLRVAYCFHVAFYIVLLYLVNVVENWWLSKQ